MILQYFVPSPLLSLLCLCAVLPDIDRLLSAPTRPAPAMLLIQEHEGIARPLFSSPLLINVARSLHSLLPFKANAVSSVIIGKASQLIDFFEK